MSNAFDKYRPIVDWLSYRSYEWNRFTNPDIPAEIFIKHYPQGEQLEKIYQENLKRIEEKGVWGHVQFNQ